MADNNESSNSNCCSICLEAIPDNHYELPCKHVFHVDCIISWFRSENSSGECPLCRSIPTPGSGIYVSHYDLQSRINEARRMARRKDCPEILKRPYAKIQKITKEIKDTRNELRTAMNTTCGDSTMKDIVSKYRKLRSKVNRLEWKKMRANRNLGSLIECVRVIKYESI